MKSKRRVAGFMASVLLLWMSSTDATAQTPSTSSTPGSSTAPAPAMARTFGTITAVNGNTVTVKSDAGVEQKVVLKDATRMVQTAPGQTNLAGATAMHAQDLEVGDRVSVRGIVNGDGALDAVSLIAMKQAEVQKKQDADREDWKQHGVSGVVKLVDSATGTVTVATGSGPASKTLAIHAAKTTIIRRYAPDSAKLADARPAALSQTKPGDEIQARGTRSVDGNEMAAAEMVVGSFRNLAGTITSVDMATGTINLMDLTSKKPYVIHCTADSQLRKLPPTVAQMLAARLKGQGAHSAAGASVSKAANSNAHTEAGQASSVTGREVPGASVEAEHRGGGDPQQMLSRAPAIQFADLRKGDAVMVVATEGMAPGLSPAGSGNATTAASVTAITLIAGVEQMLQASASGSQGLLSSSWSLGSSGPGGEASQ